MDEIVDSGHTFFGSTSGGIATAIEKVFSSYGLPNGYILGEEGGGAFVGGLTYGEGTLYTKNAGDFKLFWQGPSVGWDFGGQGSRTMMLVYNLEQTDQVYGRFGGVAGSAYFLAGVGFNVLEAARSAAGSGAHRRRGAAWSQYRLSESDRAADLEPVLTPRSRNYGKLSVNPRLSLCSAFAMA